MTFSRGLYSGWLHGVNHQELVGARFGKKRGVLLGLVEHVGRDYVDLDRLAAVKPGDGVVFDTGGDTNNEQGGRVARVEGTRLFFHGTRLRLDKALVGARMWKTNDPELEKRLRASFAGRLPVNQRGLMPLRVVICGKADQPMRVMASAAGHRVELQSRQSLVAARTKPLTSESLRNQFDRLEGTPFRLDILENQLEGEVLLSFSELNHLRRSATSQLIDQLFSKSPAPKLSLTTLLEEAGKSRAADAKHAPHAELTVLCRSIEQIQAAIDCGIQTIYADFEDIRRYPDAIELLRNAECGTRNAEVKIRTNPLSKLPTSDFRLPASPKIYLATPRIQKAGEQGFFRLIENAQPDGVLVRNIGAITYFKKTSMQMIGDFSLNVANPLTASLLLREGLQRVTISYDLNFPQVIDLTKSLAGRGLELTIHQHMPMFHMEHCVFAAFMSKGTDYTNCGRPCERHRVELKDRVGMTHPLRADVGCRNTLFNAVAQSGARFFEPLQAEGINWFRVELLSEGIAEAKQVITAYQALLLGTKDGLELWKKLNARNQLGVTSGTLIQK